jgi:hypothetical protein
VTGVPKKTGTTKYGMGHALFAMSTNSNGWSLTAANNEIYTNAGGILIAADYGGKSISGTL